MGFEKLTSAIFVEIKKFEVLNMDIGQGNYNIRIRSAPLMLTGKGSLLDMIEAAFRISFVEGSFKLIQGQQHHHDAMVKFHRRSVIIIASGRTCVRQSRSI